MNSSDNSRFRYKYHHQKNGLIERRIRTLKQMIRNFINKRQNNCSGTLPAIAAAIFGAPHALLGISPYPALYERRWKIFNPVQRSVRAIPAVDAILNGHEVARIGGDMARQDTTFLQTVQADKCRKPLPESFKNGSRVLIMGPPYTSLPGRSKKRQPRSFAAFTVAEHGSDTNNYKLTLPRRMDRRKSYFHVSSLKEYQENTPDRFASRKMDKPAPIVINNAEEWKTDDIPHYHL